MIRLERVIGKSDINKVKKIKRYILNNIWDILAVGISVCAIFINLMSLCVSEHYSRDCSHYYGIDKKYFDGSSIFQDKMDFLVLIFISFLYLLVSNYVNTKLKSKICAIGSFIGITFLLFVQNITYTVTYIASLKSEWWIAIIDNSITIIIFLISDIIIAYFFILRKSFGKKKPLIKLEKKVLALALVIYLLNSFVGISQVLNSQISEKRFYEVIDNNKVVITNYEGKFLVMDCGVQGEILNIEKGKYYFIEMTNVDVQYKKYKDVNCK